MTINAVKGEQHWNARLTWEKVHEIRSPANDDESNAELARRYGVNKTTIRLIRANSTWHDPDYAGVRSKHLGRGMKT